MHWEDIFGVQALLKFSQIGNGIKSPAAVSFMALQKGNAKVKKCHISPVIPYFPYSDQKLSMEDWDHFVKQLQRPNKFHFQNAIIS